MLTLHTAKIAYSLLGSDDTTLSPPHTQFCNLNSVRYDVIKEPQSYSETRLNFAVRTFVR